MASREYLESFRNCVCCGSEFEWTNIELKLCPFCEGMTDEEAYQDFLESMGEGSDER